MEYDQLEQGGKLILRCINTQDVSSFVEILSRDVLLITHFPPPCIDPAATALIETFRRRKNPKKQLQHLLREQEEVIAQQHLRYREHLERMGLKKGDPSNEDGVRVGEVNAAGEPVTGGAEWDEDDEDSFLHPSTKQKQKMAKASGVMAAVARRNQQRRGALGSSPPRDPFGVTVYFDPETEKLPANTPNAVDYVNHIDISEGPLFVAERFFELLCFIAQERHIATTKLTLKARKGILQDNEVLPPPPTARTLRERFALLGRQYTDRNQMLSRLTVTWGKDTLLFFDQYYFKDGLVQTIHRFLVPLHEMIERPIPDAPNAGVTHQAELIRESVLKLYGKSDIRVDASLKTHPLLDFSFLDVRDTVQLLHAKPCSGKPHKAKEPRPEEDSRFTKGVFLTTDNDPQKSRGQRTLIKAKNKKGEEEAYEFDASKQLMLLDNEEETGDSIEMMIDTCVKYDAHAVRISSCHLTERTEKLPAVLRGLVANAFVTIHSLDLSDNHISKLPQFSTLPLQKLFLHGNCIEDWEEVEKNVLPLPFTVALTLHGNPISLDNPNYWPFALSRILSHPNRQVRLKKLDFVTLSSQDYAVAGAYEMFTTGKKSIFLAEDDRKRGGRGVVKGEKKATLEPISNMNSPLHKQGSPNGPPAKNF